MQKSGVGAQAASVVLSSPFSSLPSSPRSEVGAVEEEEWGGGNYNENVGAEGDGAATVGYDAAVVGPDD